MKRSVLDSNTVTLQALVVQRLDNAIHSFDKTNHAIHRIVIYPVDSVIHFSNNRDQIKYVKVNSFWKHLFLN